MFRKNVTNFRNLLFSAFFCTFLLLGNASAQTEATDPLEQVKAAVDEIISLLQDQDLLQPEKKHIRRERVIQIVEQNFDFREMSQLTLGKNWRTISAADQDRFVALFTELLENTYITKIESYSGEKVVFKKQLFKGKKAMVYSDLVRNNIETPVNYKLVNESGKWMVYDVVIEGVSLVRNYRTQFDSVINQEKFPGLLVRLEEKIKQNEEAQAQ